MYFRHWLFHIEQQHCEQSILSIIFRMDNPNLLNCLILTETPSLSLPPSLFSSIFLPLSPLSLLPYIYISLFLHPSLFIFPSFSSSLLLSSSLPLYLPLILFPPSLSPSPPSHILPSLYFASLLFSLLEALSLNPTLHDTSYSFIFFSLSIISSLFIPLPLFLHLSPFPSLSMLFQYT